MSSHEPQSSVDATAEPSSPDIPVPTPLLSTSDLLSLSPLEILLYARSTDASLCLPASPTVRPDVDPLHYPYWAALSCDDLNVTDILMQDGRIVDVNAKKEAWIRQRRTGSEQAEFPAAAGAGDAGADTEAAPVPLRGCYGLIPLAMGDACLEADTRESGGSATGSASGDTPTPASSPAHPAFLPLHRHPHLQPVALPSHHDDALLLPPLPAQQYRRLANIALAAPERPCAPYPPSANVIDCAAEGFCPGELENTPIACDVNVGSRTRLPPHLTSLPYLYAVEYARAYMREVLCRGQSFVRFKRARPGEHTVRRVLLRAARDDMGTLLMYKSLCGRVLGAEARLRFPPADRAPGMAEDYDTPFYDDTERFPVHPLNRDSVYDLEAQARCPVSGAAVAQFICENGYIFEFARSLPLSQLVEVSYGMLAMAPGDVLGPGERMMVPTHSLGISTPVLTRPDPPAGARPPYFHMDPSRGGAEDPTHPDAAYSQSKSGIHLDPCGSCSSWHSPAAVWVACGRHSGEDRCNCPHIVANKAQSVMTRTAEDIFLLQTGDIQPGRCLTVTFTPRHGTLVLQAQSAFQALCWVKSLAALARLHSSPASVRPRLRLDEYFYAPLDPVAAARKIDDLFSLLPAASKAKPPSQRSIWERLLINAVAIPQTDANYEALHGPNPLGQRFARVMDDEEAASGPGSPLSLLRRASERGALALSPHLLSYAMHLHHALCRRLLVAGRYAAVVGVSVRRDRAKQTVVVSAPRVVFLRMASDLRSFVWCSDDSHGALRQGVPLEACCGVLEGAASPLYGRVPHPVTLRFAATRTVADALHPLLSRVDDDATLLARHPPSPAAEPESTSDVRPSPSPPRAAQAGQWCRGHRSHVDVHLTGSAAASQSLYSFAARWAICRAHTQARRRAHSQRGNRAGDSTPSAPAEASTTLQVPDVSLGGPVPSPALAMHPAAPALHQHPLVSNLAMTTHLDAATVADMRRLLRNNLQSQRYSFDELFRVSHVLTNFSGLGDLLLTNFRPFGLGVVLRRISLQRSGPRASGLAPIEGAADSPVDAAVLGVLLERVAAAAACLSPHLITVLGYFVGAPSLPGSEADPAPGLYVVTELSDFGSISTMSFWRAPFPPARIRYIARCVLQALRYLHARGLAHGTLHAGHVFLNSRGAVKTGALFGATIRMLGLSADSEAPPSKPPQPEVDSPEEAKSDRREASLVRQGSVASVSSTGSSDPGVGSAGDAEEPGLVGVCSSSTELWPVELNTPSSQGAAEAAHADSGAGAGTAAGAGEAEPSRPPWLAPELSPTAAPTFAADVWAFGVLLLHLVSGVRPDASRQLVEQARSSPGQPWVANGQEVPLSPRLRDMVVACLREDPEARPGVAALLEHPFMEAERAGAGDAGDFAEWMRSAISEYSARKQAPKDPDLAEPSRARGEER